MIKGLAGTATAIAFPILGQNPPPESHHSSAPITKQAATEYQYRYFRPEQLKTLDALTETIIPTDEHSPGAKAARVSEYIDAIVADAPEAMKELWASGITVVEGLASSGFGKTFAECSADAQFAIVSEIAGNEDNINLPQEKFFLALKRATVDGYYTSKIGIHEDLQYQGNDALQEFSGCHHTGVL
jgi:hypothetical protein